MSSLVQPKVRNRFEKAFEEVQKWLGKFSLTPTGSDIFDEHGWIHAQGDRISFGIGLPRVEFERLSGKQPKLHLKVFHLARPDKVVAEGEMTYCNGMAFWGQGIYSFDAKDLDMAWYQVQLTMVEASDPVTVI